MEKTHTEKELKQEMEANIFACCILMPEREFVEMMNELKKANQEEETLLLLAKAFRVPLFAVVMRVMLLQKPEKIKIREV